MNENTTKETPGMKIIPPADEGEKRQPTEEEVRKEFLEMLEKPIEADEVEKAKKQILVSDLRVAELKRVLAQLHTQVAETEGEIASTEFARAIICRRLANVKE